MDGLRTYILRICCTALVCGMSAALVKGKTTAAGLVKVLTGVVMVLVVFLPLVNWGGGYTLEVSSEINEKAEQAAQEGSVAAQKAWAEGIKTAAQTYILDKAKDYDAQLSVEVTMSEEQMPLPVGVRISGRISPYGKKMLQEEITQNLGIPKEAQTWIGQD